MDGPAAFKIIYLFS